MVSIHHVFNLLSLLEILKSIFLFFSYTNVENINYIQMFCVVPSSSVRNLTIIPYTKSIFLSWEPPIQNPVFGQIIKYTITYAGVTLDQSTRVIVLNSSELTKTLLNLEEFNQYNIIVSVFSRPGRGPDAEATVTTLQAGSSLEVLNLLLNLLCFIVFPVVYY